MGTPHRRTPGVVLVYHKVMYTKALPITNNRSLHIIEEVVSQKTLPLNIGPDIDLVCPTSSFFTNIVIESRWIGAIWRPCSIQAGRAVAAVCHILCLSIILATSLNHITVLNPPVQIWGSLEFWVWSLAQCCHCHLPMQTPLMCNFHGVLPNMKLSCTLMSSENTH